jgi:hypothetical protein
MRRVCDVAFPEFENLFVPVSKFIAKPFRDRSVAVALLTLDLGEDRDAFWALPFIHGF